MTGSVTVGEFEEQLRRLVHDRAARPRRARAPRPRPPHPRRRGAPGVQRARGLLRGPRSRPRRGAKQALAARPRAARVQRRRASSWTPRSTAYFVARAHRSTAGLQLTMITNSAAGDGARRHRERAQVELVGVGGMMRRLTRSFVGPFAVHTVLGALRRPALLQRQGRHARRRPHRPRPARGRGQARDGRARRSSPSCCSTTPSSRRTRPATPSAVSPTSDRPRPRPRRRAREGAPRRRRATGRRRRPRQVA